MSQGDGVQDLGVRPDLVEQPYAELIARAEVAGLGEAQRRWGAGDYEVRGETRRGCCVHLAVVREDALLARWRYELDGRIMTDGPETGATPPPLWERP